MELIDKKLEIIRLYSLLINEYSKYVELIFTFDINKDSESIMNHALLCFEKKMNISMFEQYILSVQKMPIKPKKIILYKNAFKNESESNLIIRKQNYKFKQ